MSSNANIAGLSKDLGLVNNQFGICVSVVYATYVTFEPVCEYSTAVGPKWRLALAR
jgi:hypothetical protein